jgi:hypothetical protein
MTIVKERNKIAREIHDTVGHTLTTVLVENRSGGEVTYKRPGACIGKAETCKRAGEKRFK